MTKIYKDQQVPHIILNGILDEETKDVAIRIPRDVATSNEGPRRLLQIVDKHFMPNTFVKKMETWREQKNPEKQTTVMV